MTDKLVIILYFAIMLGAGYAGMRRSSRNADDFTVAGRRLLGPFMYTSAMSTVVLGGASTVGGVSLGYKYGISGMALVLMLALGITAIGVLLSKKLLSNGIYTVPDLLGRRFGTSSRHLGSAIVVFYSLMVGVSQIVAIGTVLNVVFGLHSTVAAFIGWAVITLYSVAGGMWSITLTDVIQFSIKTVGIFLILLPLSIHSAGGFGRMQEELPHSFFSPVGIGVGTIFAYFLLFFFGFMIDQGNWQRLFTARSEKVAYWGCVVSGVYCALYGLAGALIGTAGRVILPSLANPDHAYAELARTVLPVGVFGLVIAAALAATMSCASGLLIGASTVLTNDVYRPLRHDRTTSVRANRVALAGVCVAALAVSFASGGSVGTVTLAADLLAAALFVPAMGALFWPRASPAAALVSMVAGTVACLIFMVVDGLYANEPVMYGLLASLVVFVVAVVFVPASPAPSLATAGTGLPVQAESVASE